MNARAYSIREFRYGSFESMHTNLMYTILGSDFPSFFGFMIGCAFAILLVLC